MTRENSTTLGFKIRSLTMTLIVVMATVCGLNCTKAEEQKPQSKQPVKAKTTVKTNSASKSAFRGVIGESSPKIKTVGDKTFVWAGGDRDPKSSDAQWYDFTGSPIPAGELQFGIGKDRIRAIDDPLYVYPDDKRLSAIPTSRYRPKEKHATNDDLMVTGFVENGIARAYPIALLDHHELVNDDFNGIPITVGW